MKAFGDRRRAATFTGSHSRYKISQQVFWLLACWQQTDQARFCLLEGCSVVWLQGWSGAPF